MNQVKVFCERDTRELEKEINNFLEENDAVQPVNFLMTEAVIDGNSWMTVLLFYKVEG